MLDARRPRDLALIVAGCVLLSILFFAPRLWLMREHVPGSFQWDRGHTYLQQCEQPLRRDIETAMQWRLLPPLVAHYLGLQGLVPLVLPWLGVLALLGYVAVLHTRRLPNVQFVFGGTLLVATTSGVLVPLGWLGINDAWVWLGLLAVAFGQVRWAIPTACLLCPWVDERFLIGLPLAWVIRCLDKDAPFSLVGFFSPVGCCPTLRSGLHLAAIPRPTAPQVSFSRNNGAPFCSSCPWLRWDGGWDCVSAGWGWLTGRLPNPSADVGSLGLCSVPPSRCRCFSPPI